MKCIRCFEFKDYAQCIRDHHLIDVCRQCLTDEEVNDYIASPLTMVMKGLKPKEKSKIIKGLISDFKQQRLREKYNA